MLAICVAVFRIFLPSLGGIDDWLPNQAPDEMHFAMNTVWATREGVKRADNTYDKIKLATGTAIDRRYRGRFLRQVTRQDEERLD